MGADRTAAAETAAAQPSIRRAEADSRPGGADGHSVRAPQRPAVEHAATRDGLRVGHDLLAAARPLATRRRVEAPARGAAGRTPPPRRARSGPRRRRQFVAPRAARGKKTGPNPTDRRKAGSKHHVLTDAHGIPLVASLTAANRHDITEFCRWSTRFRPCGGAAAAPRQPALVQGDLRFAAASRPPSAAAFGPNSPSDAPPWQWPRPHALGRRAHPGLAPSVPSPRRPLRASPLRARSVPHPRLRPRMLVLPETRHLISQRALRVCSDFASGRVFSRIRVL